MIQHVGDWQASPLAMIDCGCAENFRPSQFIRRQLGFNELAYLFITNADQDHMSDLHGFDEEGIHVRVLYRNRSYTGEQLRAIKLRTGAVTDDAEWYIEKCHSYVHPVTETFSDRMNGINVRTFWNKYPEFTDTNNLSLVVFVEYSGFKILFPGDLERDGWLALLQQERFREALKDTNVLVASHHGRQSGFCREIFDYFVPDAVVISDKPIAHESQRTVPDYSSVISERGVGVRTTGKRRHVLTTRRDGSIEFQVSSDGYTIDTEFRG